MSGKKRKQKKARSPKSRSQKYIEPIGSPILRKEIISSCAEYDSQASREKLISSPGWKSFCKRAFMVYRLMHKKDAAAISANQLNFPFPAFIWAPEGKFEIVLCPLYEVWPDSKKVTDIEGCLSIPGEFFPVKRESEVVLHGWDHFGKPLPRRTYTGFLARVIQHEVDHLNGLLIVDHISKQDKATYLESIRTNNGRVRKKHEQIY